MLLYLILPAFIGFIVTVSITPSFIKKFKSMGITGKDVHKKNKPEVAEMGGIPILIGFMIGYIFIVYFFISNLIELSAILATVFLAGIIGITDDMGGMRQRAKAILPVFAAIPLMLILAGHHTMFIPLLGNINFGLIYPIIFIPIAITVVSNAFNMLAGYNGLEAGSGLIACFFMGLAAFMTGNLMIASFLFCLSGTLLAFLYYNKYPAKIFIGDTGVFIIGCAIAIGAIMANLEVVGIIILLPYIINGAITTTDILRGKPIKKFATIDKNGFIKPPEGENVNTLYYIIANFRKTTEKKLVCWLFAFEFFCGLISILLIFLK